MPGQAHIEDTEALDRLRIQLVKFVEVLSSAVAEAAGEVNRTAQWLELDRTQHWKLQLRKREEKYQQALEALRMKQFFKGPSGEKQSTVDEMKRVKVCRAMVEEAQLKEKAVAMHKNRLSREKILFQGALARMNSIANQTGPLSIEEIKHLILALEKYGQITSEAASEAATAAGLDLGMTRAASPDASEAPTGAGSDPAGADAGSAAQPEPDQGVNWKEVTLRALDSRKRIDGEVVIEKGALLGSKALIWRDFLKGKVYIAHPAALTPPSAAEAPQQPVDAANWETRPLQDLLAAIVGLPEVFDKPGDRRVIIEEGRVVWSA